MGIQVSKGAWMQILPEGAEDSIVPLTAQCEQIESNIVQLRREKKSGGATSKRDARKDAMMRKLRDEVSVRVAVEGSGFAFWRDGFEKDCWWACRMQDGTLRRAKTSQRILSGLGSKYLPLLYWHSLVIAIVSTCTNS